MMHLHLIKANGAQSAGPDNLICEGVSFIGGVKGGSVEGNGIDKFPKLFSK